MSRVDETKKAILKYIEEKGFVRTAELSLLFDLTPQSIRRYSKDLSEKGLITKFHGGLAKNNFDGLAFGPGPVKYYNTDTLRVASASLVFVKPLDCVRDYYSDVEKFLMENTRVEPIKYTLYETKHKDWASSENDKLIRKLIRKQIIIFSELASPTGIKLALLASNKGMETFFVCDSYNPENNVTWMKLREEGVKLFTLARFKSDWKYAHI